MAELKKELRLALSTIQESLLLAEEARRSLIESTLSKLKKRVKDALEESPEMLAVVERVDRLVLFQRLLRNIQMNLTIFRNGYLDLRPNQLRSIHKLVEFLQAEGYGGISGYIKQPTGAGKTVLFGVISRLCDVATLILVPKLNLLEQTKRELVEVVGYPEEMIGLIGGGSNDYQKPILVATYQSHRSLITRDEKYASEVQSCQLVICDEAHRSLGTKTLKSLSELDVEFDDLLTEEEEKAEEEILNHLETYAPARALKIGFTATPKLAGKHVQDAFDYMIAEEKHADLVKSGILVPYRIVHTDGTITEEDLEGDYLTQNKEIEILHRENAYQKLLGEYMGVLMQYRKTKKKHQYPMRGAAFCVKISECDRFASEAQALGLRTKIVTSRETKGMNRKQAAALLSEAERQLLAQEIDLIVTVTKLAEGWDFPPANAAIWARASQSPALIMQGVGRTARSYEDEKGRRKDFSYVFETDWHLQSKNRKKVPLTIADALAKMGESPADCCEMADGSELKVRIFDAEYVRSYLKENYTPEEWAGFDSRGRGAISIKGYKITAIAALLGIPGHGVSTETFFAIGRLLWGDLPIFSVQSNEELRENVLTEMRRLFTPKTWVAQSAKNLKYTYVLGLGMGAVSTLLGCDVSPLLNKDAQIKLGKIIWGDDPAFDLEEQKVKQRERIRKMIKSDYTPTTWAKLTVNERYKMEYEGLKMKAVGTLFNIDGMPHQNTADHLALGRAIWGERKALETHDISDLKAKIAEQIRTDYSPEEWRNMHRDERSKLSYEGLKITAIASLFGVRDTPFADKGLYKLGSAIWDDPDQFDKEKIEQGKKKELIECIKQKYSAEEWNALGPEERRIMRINGMSLHQIATLFGVSYRNRNTSPFHREITPIIWVKRDK